MARIWKDKAAGETPPSPEPDAVPVSPPVVGDDPRRSGLVRVRLCAPHHHAGVRYEPGTEIDVTPEVAERIRSFGSST